MNQQLIKKVTKVSKTVEVNIALLSDENADVVDVNIVRLLPNAIDPQFFIDFDDAVKYSKEKYSDTFSAKQKIVLLDYEFNIQLAVDSLISEEYPNAIFDNYDFEVIEIHSTVVSVSVEELSSNEHVRCLSHYPDYRSMISCTFEGVLNDKSVEFPINHIDHTSLFDKDLNVVYERVLARKDDYSDEDSNPTDEGSEDDFINYKNDYISEDNDSADLSKEYF